MQHQVDGGVLIILPVHPAVVAQIDQKAHHHRLIAVVAEELDVLFLILIVDLEVLGFQIRDVAPFIVGDRHRAR